MEVEEVHFEEEAEYETQDDQEKNEEVNEEEVAEENEEDEGGQTQKLPGGKISNETRYWAMEIDDIDAVEVLLTLCAKPEIKAAVTDPAKRKSSIWQSIAKKLDEQGFKFPGTIIQAGFSCNQKYRNLKSKYRGYLIKLHHYGRNQVKPPKYHEYLKRAFGGAKEMFSSLDNPRKFPPVQVVEHFTPQKELNKYVKIIPKPNSVTDNTPTKRKSAQQAREMFKRIKEEDVDNYIDEDPLTSFQSKHKQIKIISNKNVQVMQSPNTPMQTSQGTLVPLMLNISMPEQQTQPPPTKNISKQNGQSTSSAQQNVPLGSVMTKKDILSLMKDLENREIKRRNNEFALFMKQVEKQQKQTDKLMEMLESLIQNDETSSTQVEQKTTSVEQSEFTHANENVTDDADLTEGQIEEEIEEGQTEEESGEGVIEEILED